MKKRNMLTKVAALSMAGLMTVTGLPVAGLDGALAEVEAATKASTSRVIDLADSKTAEVTVGDEGILGFGYDSSKFTKSGSVDHTTIVGVISSANASYAGNGDLLGVNSGAPFQAISAGSINVNFEVGIDTGSYTSGTSKTIKVSPVSLTKLDTLVVGVSNGTVEALNDKGSSDFDLIGKSSLTFYNAGANDLKVYVKEAAINGVDVTADVTAYVDGLTTTEIGNAAKHTLRVAGTGNVTDDKTYNVEIKKNPLGSTAYWEESSELKNACAAAVYSVNGATVSGADAMETLLTGKNDVYAKNTVVVSAGNANIEYSSNNKTGTDVGQMKITGKADSNINGTYTKKFTIIAKDLKGQVFSDKSDTATNVANGEFTLPNQLYTGSQIKPSFKLYDVEALDKYTDSRYDNAYEPFDNVYMKDSQGNDDKDHCLRYVELSSSDYDVTYDTNKEVGVGHVYVTGKNNYKSSSKVTFTFNIVDKTNDISNAKVTMTKDGNTLANGGNVTYTGSDIEIDSFDVDITNKDGGVDSLSKVGENSGSNGYSVSYKNNKNKGTATVIITGEGKYAGKVEKTFTITPKDIEDVDAVKNVSVNDVEYTGVAKTPSIKSQLENVLTEGKDYSVYYDNNVNAGEHATITIQGNGNYKGKVVKEFEITAKDLDSDWFEEVENVVYTGSEITPDVVAECTLGDGEKYTLVKDKDYKLTYDNNIGNSDNAYDQATINVEGINNYKGTTSVYFNIVPASNDLSKAEITLANDTVDYDGEYHAAVIEKVQLGDKVLENKDYTLVKSVSEKEAGTYTVQIKGTTTGSEYYGGIGETTFTIVPKAAKVDFKLSATKKTYNGKAQTVKVTNVTRDGVEITEDDYTVSGATKATNAGKNTVTVTLKGNYSGSAKKTWTIAKAKQTIKVSPASKTFKAKKVAKKAQTFKIKVTGAKGTKTFKSSSKKVTVSKAGKVTVKKGTKKGTYKITVSAKATKNYNAAASKTVKVVVK